jgi:hypothetical protein
MSDVPRPCRFDAGDGGKPGDQDCESEPDEPGHTVRERSESPIKDRVLVACAWRRSAALTGRDKPKHRITSVPRILDD